MTGTFETFGRYLDRCESPLERRFLTALLFSGKFTFQPVTGGGAAAIAEDAEGIVLGQQVPVGGFRVDFAMKRRGSRRRIAIELDGETFHSLPEHVERDKVRDRILIASGWTTARFTAKEVLQDALSCAQQARFLATMLDEAGAAPPPLARGRRFEQLPLHNVPLSPNRRNARRSEIYNQLMATPGGAPSEDGDGGSPCAERHSRAVSVAS